MRRLPAWMLACVALGLPAMLGCGRGASPGDAWVDRLPLPADTMRVSMDETGRHGGRFVWGDISGPMTFNPVVANEASSRQVNGLIWTQLLGVDPRSQAITPALARSWDVSSDQRTVTFHLRRGARFSDGHPITSEDVKFSFDVCLSPSIPTAMQSMLTMEVDGKDVPFQYSAPDSYTFVITTPRPDATVLAAAGVPPILPRHVLEPAVRAGVFPSAYGTGTRPESLVTSGPFRVGSFTANERTVLVRNPYWFGVDAMGRRLPYLDELVILVVPDQSAAMLKFQGGELDGLDNIQPEEYPALEDGQKRGRYRVYDAGPSVNTSFLYLNLNRAHAAGHGRKAGDPVVEPWKFVWFSNPEFRKALSYAVDRDAIVKSAMSGFGIPAWSIMTKGVPAWYDSTVTGADHDARRAMAILDSLGLKDRNGDGVREDAAGHPVSFSLLYNTGNQMRGNMAVLLQQDFARVGVKLVPTAMDFNTVVAHVRYDFQYEAVLGGLGMGSPADPALAANFFKSTGISHYWAPGQPPGRPNTPAEARIDSLFGVNSSTLDLAVRRETYRQMSQILNDECFLIWLPTTLIRVAVRDHFGNVRPASVLPRVLWNGDQIFDRRASRPPA